MFVHSENSVVNYQSINQSNFYSANIHGEAWLSDTKTGSLGWNPVQGYENNDALDSQTPDAKQDTRISPWNGQVQAKSARSSILAEHEFRDQGGDQGLSEMH